MHRSRLHLILTILLVTVSLLTACGKPATVAPTAVPPTIAPTLAPTVAPTAAPTKAPAAAKPAITVNGKAFTLADLKAIKAADGVGILALLKAAGVGDFGSIKLVAADGFSAEVAAKDLNDQAYLAYDADGTLDAVIPTVAKGSQPRDVVEIKIGAAASTGSGSASAPAALTVNGKAFALDALKAMKQVEVDVSGTKVAGPAILDLLTAAGAANADAITLVGADGYEARVETKDLDAQSILAINKSNKLDTVAPKAPKGASVKDVVAIKVSTAAPSIKAAVTVNGKAFTLDDLKAMKPVEITAGDKKYTGVRILDLFKTVGVTTAVSVTLKASDGFAGEAAFAEIDDQAILEIGADGKLNAVIPKAAKKAWVKDTIEITTSAGAAAMTGPVKFTDAAGRTVELATLPQRIMVVGKGPYMALHALYMFPEGKQRLVATEKRGATASDFLIVLDPAFAKLPTTEASPGIEQIATYKPDFVIMKGAVTDKTAEALTVAKIPYMYINLETPEQYARDITNLGLVLGNPARAKEITAYYQTKLDRLKKITDSIDASKKPRVMVAEYFDRGGKFSVEVPPKAWMQTIQAQTAGGAPVWLDAAGNSDGWTVVNLEQIAAWNPDQIFLIVWYTLDPKQVLNELKADPQWSQLKAVKNGQLYAFPQDIFGWDTPEPRWILGMTWLATKMHAGMTGDINIQSELYEWGKTLYGMDKAAVDAIIMPKANLDVK